jgi:hypothetical protein
MEKLEAEEIEQISGIPFLRVVFTRPQGWVLNAEC